MQWFGEPWPSAELRAPVCEDDSLRVPLPPGEECALCGNPIKEDAQGVVIPHMSASDMFVPGGGVRTMVMRYNHLGCLLNNVGGEGISWQEPETGPGKTVRL